MDVAMRSREKVKAGDVPVGECFKEIQKARCLQVIDLTQADMFREPTEGSVLYLREDVVYVVEIGTGVVSTVPKVQEVHRVYMKAEEVR